jgi:uncharacterized membrane protein YozB (DUF420 family)
MYTVVYAIPQSTTDARPMIRNRETKKSLTPQVILSMSVLKSISNELLLSGYLVIGRTPVEIHHRLCPSTTTLFIPACRVYVFRVYPQTDPKTNPLTPNPNPKKP